MVMLAICVALACVVGIFTIPFLPSLRKSEFVKPSSFTFSAREALPAIVANPVPATVQSEVKTLTGYPPIQSKTAPMPVLIMMDKQCGEELPSVFVDVGIWCD